MTNVSTSNTSQLHPPVQVNPLHVDRIVKEVLKKEHWKEKIHVLENKWHDECLNQGISKASAKVAFDIIRDVEHLGKGVKKCCGCCGAKPVKRKWDESDDEVEINPDESLFHKFTYSDKQDLTRAIINLPAESLIGVIDIINFKLPEGDNSEELTIDMDGLDDETLCKLASFVELTIQDNQVVETKVQEKPEESLEEKSDDELTYSRSTKFCLCPCKHCALKVDKPPKSICAVHDNLIPLELASELRTQIDKIVMATPNEKLDWHPGSNNQVLDIIHPSLYCYSSTHSIVSTDTKVSNKVKTQWIPTTFSIDESKHATPQSYINNINPVKQKKLENTICKVLDKFIEPVSKFVNIKDECQVIVKAANIIVTPEQGSFYPGGTWHTEGNTEEIVATGIYYYHTENVKNSYLEFRSYINDENIDYEQDNVEEAFENSGLHDGDLLFEHCGAVETMEGRCIVFPNTRQHRVKHFFALDPTREARRNILVFFFVNPHMKIVSTSDIDVQRRDFLVDRCLILAQKIPVELVSHIVDYLPHMSLKIARQVRSELMAERKFVRDGINEDYYEREFSLCEH